MDSETDAIQAIFNTEIHLSPLLEDAEFSEEHWGRHGDGTEANKRFVLKCRAESAMLRYVCNRFGESFSIRSIQQNDRKDLLLQLGRLCIKQGMAPKDAVQAAIGLLQKICQEQVATFLLSLRTDQQENIVDLLGLREDLQEMRREFAASGERFDELFDGEGITDDDFDNDMLELAPFVQDQHSQTRSETGLKHVKTASDAADSGELESAMMLSITNRITGMLGI